MIEAELKARVREPAVVRERLERLAVGCDEVYRDTYFDTPGADLEAGDRELRLRTVDGPDGTRALLTYKGARVDEVSGSKPEYETSVGEPEAVRAMLGGLGYVEALAFEKHCRNYELIAYGRPMLATLVRVPDIDGTYVEVETQVASERELRDALGSVRAVLDGLGIGEDDLTAELYTDAVRARRDGES
ncbi:adenylyl cyclase [Streptomyces griseoflavus]|uniref:class IV adenylate cyclase n=1 Tax=Streptomyces rimosus TaxID=1927 RepID=UPI0004CB3C72|nr:class IV adenylate cyclase [Streptomyces rimosus]KOG66319.1 adenylyl cyclase [Streptomyces griseoflavus]